jgi:ADP-ribosylglycohydrolase
MSAVGSLLGTAVGDAMGLPYEALSKRRAARMFGEPTRFRLLPGRGMVSDDTEHTVIVAQSLIASGGEPVAFAGELATRLRWWLLGLPAGIGFATLRALVKLWLGFGPHKSGVFSAGNGPAMRSAIIGASIDDEKLMRRLVSINTRITHTDPKAEHGALAVALAAHLVARQKSIVRGEVYHRHLAKLLGDDPAAKELLDLVAIAAESAASGDATETFARTLGLDGGVTGYVYATVPVCIHAWLRHPRDYETAIGAVIKCGGDTDTCAAIVGGIVGSHVGKPGIPREWLEGLAEWPRTLTWMEGLGATLERSRSRNAPEDPPSVFGPFVLARNVAFMAIVLAHVARRCLPPY